MKEHMYGISYSFSHMPDAETISNKGIVEYSPIVVCYNDNSSNYQEIQFPNPFKINPHRYDIFKGKKGYYKKLGKMVRENQERLIADFISAIILKELRSYPDDKFIFVIKDAFETEKFVGRLGYLGLPLNNITIYFVSSNLKDLLTNYISPFSEKLVGDLTLLKDSTNKLFGPFPEDEAATMLRMFYLSFSNPELYPLRINLFSQFMNRSKLEHERKNINELFNSKDWTEVYEVDGGRGQEKTRLPKILIKCEDYIKNNKHLIKP